jgi:two-component system, OmpR family, response regulator
MAKILIVDDTPGSFEPIAKYLGDAGHAVTCVPNGREALASVLAVLPDVILLDLVMPEMDGPTFLEIIRSYLRLHTLPVVVLTGVDDSPMVARVQTLKVNSVLAKGKASLEEIQRAVEEAVARLPG